MHPQSLWVPSGALLMHAASKRMPACEETSHSPNEAHQPNGQGDRRHRPLSLASHADAPSSLGSGKPSSQNKRTITKKSLTARLALTGRSRRCVRDAGDGAEHRRRQRGTGRVAGAATDRAGGRVRARAAGFTARGHRAGSCRHRSDRLPPALPLTSPSRARLGPLRRLWLAEETAHERANAKTEAKQAARLRAPPRPPPCGDRPPEGEEKHLGRPGVCFS